jgi:hypothetical protein
MRELVPTANPFGLLVNPSAPGADLDRQEAETAAAAFGLNIVALSARSERVFGDIFARIVREQIGALIISPDALFTSCREQLVALAARCGTDHFSFAGSGGRRRLDELRDKHHRCPPGSGHLHRPHPKRRAARPIASSAIHQIRAGDQPKTAKALNISVPDKLLRSLTK